jgi:hypothetical protein
MGVDRLGEQPNGKPRSQVELIKDWKPLKPTIPAARRSDLCFCPLATNSQMTAHAEVIRGSLGEFETYPDWVPSMDTVSGSHESV